MSEPRDRFPWRPTDELPPARSGAGTEPMATRPRPSPRPPSRFPVAWLVVGLLAILLIFFLGFLAGRAGRSEPADAAAGTKEGKACVRAAALSARVTRLHRQALANRVAFTRALAMGAEDELAALDAQLRDLSADIDQLRGKSQKALGRCHG